MSLTDADEQAIRAIITQQLQAFQTDDAPAAFALAAPAIQALFGTPATFMQMVRRSYPAVYRPRSVVFDGMTQVAEYPAQQVMLMDAQGNLIRALYIVMQQQRGSWRIAGCHLLPIAEETAE
ncbi:MAG: DUF4864 domain-containing protein [Cyanobacteria bacterium J06632_22]